MVLSSIIFAQTGGWVFIDPDKPLGNTWGWRIQVGAFIYRRNAERTATHLEQKIELPIYIVVENPWYKVLVGDFRSKDKAEEYLDIIHRIGYKDAFVRESMVNIQNAESVSPSSPSGP